MRISYFIQQIFKFYYKFNVEKNLQSVLKKQKEMQRKAINNSKKLKFSKQLFQSFKKYFFQRFFLAYLHAFIECSQ